MITVPKPLQKHSTATVAKSNEGRTSNRRPLVVKSRSAMKMALSGRLVITVPSLFFIKTDGETTRAAALLLEQAGNTDFSRRSIYSRGAVPA